jgi:hypothetical protein
VNVPENVEADLEKRLLGPGCPAVFLVTAGTVSVAVYSQDVKGRHG